MVLIWLIDVMLHLDLIYSLQCRQETNASPLNSIWVLHICIWIWDVASSYHLVISVPFNWWHVNLIQKLYLKQYRNFSFWTVIFKLLEVLIINLIFICKKDLNVFSLNLTSQPIVTVQWILLGIKQQQLTFKLKSEWVYHLIH